MSIQPLRQPNWHAITLVLRLPTHTEALSPFAETWPARTLHRMRREARDHSRDPQGLLGRFGRDGNRGQVGIKLERLSTNRALDNVSVHQ
jgi:hypothetical protein